MARRKREPMSEGKKNIIGMLLEEYDIKSAKDIEDALKDLLGGTIQVMLESEMDEHLGYQEYERSDNPDSRNGKKTARFLGRLVRAGDGTRTCDRELFLKRRNRTIVRRSFSSVYHTLLGLSSSFGSLSADLREQVFPFGVP